VGCKNEELFGSLGFLKNDYGFESMEALGLYLIGKSSWTY